MFFKAQSSPPARVGLPSKYGLYIETRPLRCELALYIVANYSGILRLQNHIKGLRNEQSRLNIGAPILRSAPDRRALNCAV